MDKPLPNWTEVFTRRPDLEPPGFATVFLDIVDNPKERPARGTVRGKKGKEARWTPIKHQSPDP